MAVTNLRIQEITKKKFYRVWLKLFKNNISGNIDLHTEARAKFKNLYNPWVVHVIFFRFTNSRIYKFLFSFSGKLASYTQRPWSSSRARVLDWSSQHCTENSSQRSYRQRRTRTQNLVSSRHSYPFSRNLKSYEFTNFLFTNT